MYQTLNRILSIKGTLIFIASLTVAVFINAQNVLADLSLESSPEVIAEGKQLAFDRGKGNCLACHAIDDGTLAGNNGPPLFAMKVRFPEVSDLRAKIWDSNASNPNSIMPPFGRHGILTDDEIDKITVYLLTL